MAFSFVLARLLPFELFLFSYIILGPLHYMTELAWLKERNFFITSNPAIKVFLSTALLGIIISLLMQNINAQSSLMVILSSIYPLVLLGGFVLAAVTIHDRLPFLAGVIIIGLALLLIFITRLDYPVYLLCLLIPTLIHTTLFTGNFILEGALKNKSRVGYISFLFFIVFNIGFFILPTNPMPLINKFIQSLFLESNFYNLNLNVNYLIYGNGESNFVLDSAIGIRIQGFIAFAYTYHYLNWFSKTNVIKWHKISKPWLLGSVFIWFGSVSLHIIDIKLGIMFITLLSTLHVYSEFPLNHKSFLNVGSMLRNFRKV